mmetsp:Transcript_7712/g.19635  ORF Transcript_7712/g.19635 Transcript_7712/m.19635 type:complete len:226 (+) Transcript_7712:322-999(+)
MAAGVLRHPLPARRPHPDLTGGVWLQLHQLSAGCAALWGEDRSHSGDPGRRHRLGGAGGHAGGPNAAPPGGHHARTHQLRARLRCRGSRRRDAGCGRAVPPGRLPVGGADAHRRAAHRLRLSHRDGAQVPAGAPGLRLPVCLQGGHAALSARDAGRVGGGVGVGVLLQHGPHRPALRVLRDELCRQGRPGRGGAVRAGLVAGEHLGTRPGAGGRAAGRPMQCPGR